MVQPNKGAARNKGMPQPARKGAPGKADAPKTGAAASGKVKGRQPPDEWGGEYVRQGHISGRQLMFLTAYVVGTKVLYLYPTIMATNVGSSAWLAVAIAACPGLLGLWGWVKWIRITGSAGFVSSLRRTCGRFVGDLIAVATLGILILVTGWSIRLFVGGAVIGVVPEYPIEALVWISDLTALYAAWLGVEAVARASGFFFAPTFISFALVMISLRGTFRLENLAPFWGLGAANTLVHGLVSGGTFGGIVAVAIMKPYMRKLQETGSRSVFGLLIATAVLIAGLIVVAGVFPYPMSTGKADPLGAMARSVYLGRFIQRFEALFIFVWYFSTSVHTSFLCVLDLAVLSELANTGTYRTFVPALATLTFGIAAIPANTLRAGELLHRYFTTSTGNALLLLGWVLYAVAKARGMRPEPAPEGGDPTGQDAASTPRVPKP